MTVMDNLLDEVRDCSSIIEETIDGKRMGVFDVQFDREKARKLIQDYMDGRLVGRAQ